jgi:hypothetical protein
MKEVRADDSIQDPDCMPMHQVDEQNNTEVSGHFV